MPKHHPKRHKDHSKPYANRSSNDVETHGHRHKLTRSRHSSSKGHASSLNSGSNLKKDNELCIPMEVDEVGVVKEIRKDFKVLHKPKENILLQNLPEVIHSSEKVSLNRIFIIPDTCALIGSSNLSKLENVFNTKFKVFGYPNLVIPWIVIQELDVIKDNKHQKHLEETKRSAKKAVNFIYKFLVDKHPRMLGENPKRVDRTCSNDDQILNFCVDCQQKCINDHIVFLTNDKNLCTKAILSGLRCFTSNNLKSELYNISVQHAVERKPRSTSFKDCESNKPKLKEDIKDFAEMLKTETCSILSLIIETECQEIYEKLWLKVLPIKPPWDVEDCFKVINKMWIAVFSFVFHRRNHDTFIEAQQFFRRDCVNAHKDTSQIITKVITSLKNIKENRAYSKELSSGVKKLEDILRKINRKTPSCSSVPKPSHFLGPSRDSSDNRMDVSPATKQRTKAKMPKFHSNTDTPDLSNNEASSSDKMPTKVQNCLNPEGDRSSGINDKILTCPKFSQSGTTLQENLPIVEKSLNVIWNDIYKFSALILNGLEVPHPLFFIGDANQAPSLNEIASFLPKFYPAVLALRNSLQQLCQDNFGDTYCYSFYMQLINLYYSTNTEISAELKLINPQLMILFCQKESNKKNLLVGLKQLEEVISVLLNGMKKQTYLTQEFYKQLL